MSSTFIDYFHHGVCGHTCTGNVVSYFFFMYFIISREVTGLPMSIGPIVIGLGLLVN